MSHFSYIQIGSKVDCVVYTGMYNFMNEIHVYIFRREKSLFTLIYDVLPYSYNERCFKRNQSVSSLFLWICMIQFVLYNVWHPRSFVASLFCSM